MEDNFTNFEAGTVAVEDGGVPPVARVPSTRRRNVVTQHGSYRTVDEENIVVLVRCHTPQPKEEDAEEQVVWFEDFFEPTEEEVGSGSRSMVVVFASKQHCWLDLRFYENHLRITSGIFDRKRFFNVWMVNLGGEARVLIPVGRSCVNLVF